MKVIDRIEKNINATNESVIDQDRLQISIIFQFLTMTGVVLIMTTALFLVIARVSVDLDYRSTLPLITMPGMIEQRQIDRMYVSQIATEFYAVGTPLEKDFFLETYSKKVYHDALGTNIDYNIKRSGDILRYNILEVHQEYGTSLYDEETSTAILTDSRFLILVDEFFVSRTTSITADKRSIVVDISLDQDQEIKDIFVYQEHSLIDKKLFSDYINEIDATNLASNLSYKSPLTPISISFIDIEDLYFGDLKMTVNTEGKPIGYSTLHINESGYEARVEYSNSGYPILIVE